MVQAPLATLLSAILSRLTYSVSIGWDAKRAAGALGLRLLTVDATQPRDLDRSFERIVKGGAQALPVLTDPMLSAQARQIAELATRHPLPGMYWAKWFEAGGLAAYSADHENLTPPRRLLCGQDSQGHGAC
jgi:hypothetical protein